MKTTQTGESEKAGNSAEERSMEARADVQDLKGLVRKPKMPVSIEAMNRAIRAHAADRTPD